MREIERMSERERMSVREIERMSERGRERDRKNE